jgi:signal transduction histidine kinase
MILCDIVMPEMDGYGVLFEVRNDPALATTPFVFLTARSRRPDQRTGMALGADDYITKPFTHDELLATIHAQLEKQQARRRITEQRVRELSEKILTAMPHEMRTPLVGILGYSEILSLDSHTMSSDEVAQTGRIIYRAALRLQHLIDNYLAYIQIGIMSQDAAWIGRLRQGSTVNPGPVIERYAQSVAEHAERPNDLCLNVNSVENIAMSSEYLRKVVEELVDNAFKFSSPGTPVNVSAYMHNQDSVIEVNDQGRGMSPDQIQNVGAWVQFDRKIYEQQGSGMGLIIAKRYIDLHGGRLEIESSRRQGTTMRVTLPG